MSEAMREHPCPSGPCTSCRGFAGLDRRVHDVVADTAHRPLPADAVERLHSHPHPHVFRPSRVQSARESTLEEHEYAAAWRDARAATRGRRGRDRAGHVPGPHGRAPEPDR
ncbi:hypothetical protein SZN_34517 [Streptomyces zinciresistens K42]|uniref:Uncharacterized protein n=1 Tax=Streptomyces zinciresistens K42 TaxID=700597 RepID=G2GMZ8_9ACTN|nr:hypothetical protein [Streptomyces zinciresistens]EGX55122.1 hypothetical protein SZN_34517 [Streptomyces zinciresistens K42]